MVTLEIPLPYYKKNSKALMTVNTYRNLHHHFLATFKREYGEKLKSLLLHIDPIDSVIQLDYQFHFKGKKKIDVSNVGSMVDKVFSDCLVEYGVIQDDSIQYVRKVSFVGYDNAIADKCIVKITPLEG